MGAEIDSLEIAVKTTANEANKSLDGLIKKLGLVAEGLSALTKDSALSDFSKKIADLSKSGGLDKSVKSLGNVKSAATAGNKLGKSFADNIIRGYKIKDKEVRANIQEMAQSIARMNIGEIASGMDNPELLKTFDKLGDTVKKNAQVLQSTTGEYENFFNYFKGLGKIDIPKNVIAELGDDWKSLRTTAMGSFSTDGSGIEIDSIYQEMSDKFKDLFSGTEDQTQQFREIIAAVKAARLDATRLVSAGSEGANFNEDDMWSDLFEGMKEMRGKMVAQMSGFSKDISRTAEEIREQYADLGKDFTMSGNEKQIENKITSLTNSLENAKLKQQELEASGNTDGKTYENTVASVVKYENQIESLTAQLDNMRESARLAAEEAAKVTEKQAASTGPNPNVFTGTINGASSEKLDDMFDNDDISSYFGDNIEKSASEAREAVKVAASDMQYNADAMAATFGEAAAQIRDWAQAVSEYGAQAGQALNNPEMVQGATETSQEINDQMSNMSKSISEKAQEIREKYAELGKSFTMSGSEKEIESKIKSLTNSLENAKLKQQEIELSGDTDGKSYEHAVASVVKYENQIESLKAQLDAMRESARQAAEEAAKVSAQSVAIAGPNTSSLSGQLQNMKGMIAQTFRDLPNLAKRAASGIAGKLSSIGAAARAAAGVAKKAILTGLTAPLKVAKKTIVSLASAIKGKLSKGFSGLTGASKGSHNSLLKNLGTILRYAIGVRTLFALVNKLRKAFTDGMQNLVKYSNETNASMSLLMNSTNQLKNSVAAAGAPILNALAPALNTIIQMCINAANAVNQLFSALTGHGTWIKAKKQTQDYAKSLGGASKAADDLRTHTLGIDELNIVDQSKNSGSGGSGGGASAADMFETDEIDSKYKEWSDKIKAMWNAGDFTELGSAVGTWLKNGLDSIPWDGIQESARKIASSIGTFINGFVETDGLATSIGTTIGQGINTAVDFANTLLDVTHWDSIGKFIGDGLNGIVNSVQWDEIGQMLANGLNAAFTMLENAATTFDWTNFGSSLALSLNTFASTFSWSGAATSLSSLVNGLLDTLIAFVSDTDWGAFGEGVMDFLVNIDWGGLAQRLVDAGYTIVTGIFDFVISGLASVDWAQVGTNLWNALYNIVTTFNYSGLITTYFTYLGTAVGALTSLGVALAQQVWNVLVNGFNATKAYFTTYIQAAGGDIVAGLFAGIVDALKSVGQWIIDNIYTPVMNGFMSAFKIHSPSLVMAEMGGYLMEGLINGIKDGWNNIKESVGTVAQSVIDKFKDILGIHSPSTVMDENGVYLIEGLQNGISGTINDVYDIFSESKWKEIGQGMLDGLIKPFESSNGIDTISMFATDIYNTISDTLSESQFSTIGTTAVSGLASSFTTTALDPIFGNLETSLMNAWNQAAVWWSGTAMPTFFSANVSPWFTTEKWKTTTDGMKTGLIAKWDEFVSQWKTKTNTWWNTNVKTWFTVEKWKEQGDHFKTALLDKWAEFETQWNTNINNWFTNNVSTWFTKEKWEPFGTNMKDGIYSGFKGIVKEVGDLVNGMIDLFNTGLSRIAESMNDLISDYNEAAKEMQEDTISHVSFRAIAHVDIPKYSVGGFPEDGLFFANHNEMVGQFSNGKTAVANNEQIVAGITAGVREAVADVLAPYLSQIAENTRETADKDTSISLDGRELVSAINSRISRNGFSFT